MPMLPAPALAQPPTCAPGGAEAGAGAAQKGPEAVASRSASPSSTSAGSSPSRTDGGSTPFTVAGSPKQPAAAPQTESEAPCYISNTLLSIFPQEAAEETGKTAGDAESATIEVPPGLEGFAFTGAQPVEASQRRAAARPVSLDEALMTRPPPAMSGRELASFVGRTFMAAAASPELQEVNHHLATPPLKPQAPPHHIEAGARVAPPGASVAAALSAAAAAWAAAQPPLSPALPKPRDPSSPVVRLDLSEALPEPEFGSPEMPTVGSANHRFGRCKPCAFLHTKGCTNGVQCSFCHLCDAGEKKRRQKERKEQKRELHKWADSQAVMMSSAMGTHLPMAAPR